MIGAERRMISGEIEARSTPKGAQLSGYAAVFERTSQNLGGFVERVGRGAFAKTIGEADIRALFNHDANYVLGRSSRGTLRLAEDKHGLAYEVDVPETQAARDVMTLVERGDITGSSFSFRVMPGKESWGFTHDDFPVRTLHEVALYDVGPVTFPAYDQTDVASIRSALGSLASDEVSLDVLVEAASRDELRSLLPGGRRSAVGFGDLPLAPRDRSWAAAAAEARVREWAGAQDGPTERYRRAFFWYGPAAEDQFGAYKLGFADVINGTLTAIPRGIFAAAAVVQGARGGTNIPARDIPGVRSAIGRYYAKMRDEFGDEAVHPPWERSAPLTEEEARGDDEPEQTSTRRVLAARRMALFERQMGPERTSTPARPQRNEAA